jgi:hypothetical protein
MSPASLLGVVLLLVVVCVTFVCLRGKPMDANRPQFRPS